MTKTKTSASSKTKKPQKTAPRTPEVGAPEAGAPEASIGAEETSPTQLTAGDMAFLRRAHLFLFNIPKYLDRARRNGYTQKEHDLGWELWTVASGKNRRFEHWIAETVQQEQVSEGSSERKRLLEEIDAFENLWFPRMRAMIARYLPKEKGTQLATAFFKDLAQQPLGPLVVDSVKTFLNRIKELETTADPDVRTLRDKLSERGLTAKKIVAVRELLAAAEEFKRGASTPLPVSPEEIAKAKDAQLKALESLRLWYNDWATTFRGVFGTRDQITLGLMTIRRKAQDDDGSDDDGSDGEDEEGDAQEEQADEGEAEGDAQEEEEDA